MHIELRRESMYVIQAAKVYQNAAKPEEVRVVVVEELVQILEKSYEDVTV